MKLLTILLGLLVAFSVTAAPDREREQRMANEIVDAILDGEPVTLQAGAHEFLAIHTLAEEPKGTVLILHGRGFHPDWPSVIQPLRVGLVEQGWSTLAIQMPVLDKAAKYYDYVEVFPDAIPRIEAALDYLEAADPDAKVVMLAHSCGYHMGQHWAHAHPQAAQTRVDAYVGLGMGATDYQQDMVEPFVLDNIQVPILDVYGDADYPAVRRSAPERWKMILEAGNPKSAQKAIPEANHYYEGRNDALLAVIAQWLNGL